MRITIIFPLAFSVANAFGQCDCALLFDSLHNTVEANYPGWADKVTEVSRPSFDALNRTTSAAVRSSISDSTCYAALQNWIAWFKDHHLKLRIPKKSSNGDHAVSEIRTRIISEKDVKELEVNVDPIVGIWANENYRLAIAPAAGEPLVFDAVVLSTGNSDWKAGDVKARLSRSGPNDYRADWIFGDRVEGHIYPAHIAGDILDLDKYFLAREWPTPRSKVDLETYSYDRDPSNPQLRFPQPDLAVFTLKSFNPDNFPLLQALLQKNAEKLRSTPNWIIDLRGNEGGDVRCGRLLLPYLYSGPIKQYNARKRVTRANVQQWWNEYIADYYASLDSAGKLTYDAYRADLLAHEGELYDPDTAAYEMFMQDSMMSDPHHVAILIDADCVSSGELFVMEARQSSKVTVMGRNSGGMIDYGDVLHYPMPCSGVKLQLPFTRFNWLDEGVHVDEGGLQPDVDLKSADQLREAIEHVRRLR